MTRKLNMASLLIAFTGVIFWACEGDNAELITEDPLMEAAEVSSQAASGMEVVLTGSSASSEWQGGRPRHGGGRPQGGGRPSGNQGYAGPPSGNSAFAFYRDTDLRLISFAEKIGDRRSLMRFSMMGAEVVHYDEDGNQVEFEFEGGTGQGYGHWRTNEDRENISQTIIDFGDGVMVGYGGHQASISGKITTDRSFADDQLTEIITIENVSTGNGVISGTKTVTRSFDEVSGEGQMTVIVNGTITLSDGSIKTWSGESSRSITVVLGEEGKRPTSAQSTAEAETEITHADGSVMYSHKTTSPIVSDMECAAMGRRTKPSSGTVETQYGENLIVVDFGNGECSDTISVTIKGNQVVVN